MNDYRYMPEEKVRRDVREYLKRTGWFIIPIFQKGYQAYKGISDLIVCKNGVVIFMELKGPKGRQSAEQKKFQDDITLAGCAYALIRSLEDAVDFIAGLQKKGFKL